MQHLAYDEVSNVRLLEQLTPRLRVAFALLCALRILPRYRSFHSATGRGDPVKLEAIADRLWEDLEGNEMTEENLERTVELCSALVPSEEEGWDEATQPLAEDAAAAVAYAARARLTGDAQEAAWAGRRAYEAVDRYVVSTMGPELEGPDDELGILSHPLIQAELNRQQRDLKDLAALGGSAPSASTLSELRNRSRCESESFLPVRK